MNFKVTECENKEDSDLNWVQYQDKCYYSSTNIESEFRSWQDAERFCNQNGGFLVSIHNQNENRFLSAKVKILL
jgi:hypothetical protein